MAVKWIIRELEQVEYPGTQLQYGVFDETGKMVSAHHEKEDAQQMAAVPLLREALDALTAVIRRSVLTPILTDKAEVQQAVDQANAALAAAKGE